MTKCEKCGNVQPGNHTEVCTKCGFVCHPVKSVRSNKPSIEPVAPIEEDEPEVTNGRPTFG